MIRCPDYKECDQVYIGNPGENWSHLKALILSKGWIRGKTCEEVSGPPTVDWYCADCGCIAIDPSEVLEGEHQLGNDWEPDEEDWWRSASSAFIAALPEKAV